MKKVIIPALLAGAALIAIGCVVEKSKRKPTEDDLDVQTEAAELVKQLEAAEDVEQAEDEEVVEVVF